MDLYRANSGQEVIKTFIPAFNFSSHVSQPRPNDITPKKIVKITNADLNSSKLKQKKSWQTISDIDKWISNKTWINRTAVVVKRAGRPILEHILPYDIVESRLISRGLAAIHHSFYIAGVFFTPVDIDLDASKRKLERKVLNCSNLAAKIENLQKVDPTAENELKSSLEELKKLKNQLSNEEEKKGDAYLVYAMKFAKHALSHAALIWSFTPIKFLGDLVAIIEMIPWLSEILDFTLSSMTLKQTIEKQKIFDLWKARFQEKLCDIELSALKDRDLEVIRDNKAEQLSSMQSTSHKVSAFVVDWKKKHLDKASHAHIDELVNDHWEELLKLYVTHQDEIEESLKLTLKRLITKKQELEGVFIGFKNNQAKLTFCMSVLALSAAISFSLLPFAGAGAVLFTLASASLVFSLSFWIAHKYLGGCYRSHSSFILDLKIFYANLQSVVSDYWLNVKEEELKKLNPDFKVDLANNQKIHCIEEKEIELYLSYQTKAESRANDLESLKEKKRKSEWIDFADFAALSSTNDVISEIKELLKQMDFSLIGEEMQELLGIQLGFNVDTLAKHLGDRDESKKQKAMELLQRDLETFFTLNDDGYIDFIKIQQASLINYV